MHQIQAYIVEHDRLLKEGGSAEEWENLQKLFKSYSLENQKKIIKYQFGNVGIQYEP